MKNNKEFTQIIPEREEIEQEYIERLLLSDRYDGLAVLANMLQQETDIEERAAIWADIKSLIRDIKHGYAED